MTSKGWVVGSKMLPSGLFTRVAGKWGHLGYGHPIMTAVDYDPRDPSILYLAAGNGLIRATNGGREWKILTSHDVTELRDVSLDRNVPGTIYFAHTAGIRVSHDGGETWRDATGNRKRRYTEAVRVDRSKSGRLVAGGEDGLYLSPDEGRTWTLAGAGGFEIMHIEQSPQDACFWIAVSQQGGIFVSHDCAASFENPASAGVGRNLYDISFDATRAGRIAVGGWGPGVLVSDDSGKTWQPRNTGLPSTEIWSIAFDPDHSGRMYAGVHEQALFVSEDAGLTWSKDGLEGSIVYRMLFIPETAR